MSANPDTLLRDAHRALESARRKGDSLPIARALVTYANALAQAGQFMNGRDALDAAARLYREVGQPQDEAMASYFGASLSRFAGDLAGALERAQYTLTITDDSSATRVGAYLELGDTHMEREEYHEAAHTLAEARRLARAFGFPAAQQASIATKLAQAYGKLEQFDDALAQLDDAAALLNDAGEVTGAAHALVDKANLLEALNRTTEAMWVLGEAEALAQSGNGAGVLCQAEMLRAAQALKRQDLRAALAHAQKGESYAVQAGDAINFTGAAILIAELHDRLDERMQAYGALASGWVTLESFLGDEVAKAAFEPRLIALRDTWGEPEFARAKAAYEAERRRARGLS
jgi:tetratricopeptide (TPR) repeat protein